MTTADIKNTDDALTAAATSPRKAASDNTSAEAHSIPDLIALSKFQNAQTHRNNPAASLVFAKLVPPGTE